MVQETITKLLKIANGEVAGSRVAYPIVREVFFSARDFNDFRNTLNKLSVKGIVHETIDHGYPHGATIIITARNKEELVVLAGIYLTNVWGAAAYPACVRDSRIKRPFKDVLLRKPRPTPNIDEWHEKRYAVAARVRRYGVEFY